MHLLHKHCLYISSAGGPGNTEVSKTNAYHGELKEYHGRQNVEMLWDICVTGIQKRYQVGGSKIHHLETQVGSLGLHFEG